MRVRDGIVRNTGTTWEPEVVLAIMVAFMGYADRCDTVMQRIFGRDKTESVALWLWLYRAVGVDTGAMASLMRINPLLCVAEFLGVDESGPEFQHQSAAYQVLRDAMRWPRLTP